MRIKPVGQPERISEEYPILIFLKPFSQSPSYTHSLQYRKEYLETIADELETRQTGWRFCRQSPFFTAKTLMPCSCPMVDR